MNLPPNIQKIIDTGLTFEDIERYLPNANIVEQQAIAKMTNLNQLLKGLHHSIIYTATNSLTDGHYQCCFTDSGNFYFFDSYAMNSSEMILKVQKNLNTTWNQNPYALRNLVANSQYNNRAFTNQFKYQSNDPRSSTCGRYCLVVLLLHKIFEKENHPFNFDVFHQIMQHWQNKYKISYDEIVAYFIQTPA